MRSLAGLIARLTRCEELDRRLDADVVAAVLGPTGCVVDAVQGLDGHDVLLPGDLIEGIAMVWREAADIWPVSASFDAAVVTVREAKPARAGQLIWRALQQLPEPSPSATAAELDGQAGRIVMIELLRAMAAEGAEGATSLAA